MLHLIPLFSTTASAWEPANTAANTRAGTMTITGQTGNAIHEHGGDAARLSLARFEVKNASDAPVSIGVTHIVFLTGHGCDAPPARHASEPVFAGLFVNDGTMAASAPRVTVAQAKTALVDVGFPGVEAYYTYCDRFAFEVTFDVGGEPVTAIAETNVTRIDPIREPPRP